ncbi:hypothetical protein CAOG_04528 [Capsaspora owczarzaki ATCC 30864]|uniref:Amino acid transporter transmembrane domain-containing protein n=1 Tax=Capsaspora owczarzaki (strain ATCC 30864) TaxID=595528 RepID=A0A0D2X368_CAPO3|nr:hypothetical protein CAOG_04528 [Capsaspora owczarzaki ATCC 30864]KJE93784.1 hypothetical protein CAOG_004528 [Capsaspora owczarzaki ATCC 30864]|eukprot:XP_004347275.1 hypothetical protein CAOG_04528 [Capsaspora owczarzaki ATCC 30864]
MSDEQRSLLDGGVNGGHEGLSKSGARANGYSPMVAYAFTVNMIIGAGILGLPFAFYNGGVVLSIILLFIASFLCFVTLCFLIEACARAEAFADTLDGFAEPMAINDRNDSEHAALVRPAASSATNRLSSHGTFSSSYSARLAASNSAVSSAQAAEELAMVQERMTIGYSGRKFEVSELCGLFLAIYVEPSSWWARFADANGFIHPVRRFYELSIFLYNCGAMWLYSSIFASALSVVIPLTFLSGYHSVQPDIGTVCQTVTSSGADAYCVHAYYFFLALYATIMIPIVCLDLTAQRKLQMSLTLFAFFCMIVMIITVLVAVDHAPYSTALPNVSTSAPYFDTSRLFEISGFGKIFTTAIVAQVAHPGAPGFVVLVRDKMKTRRIFGAALSSTFLFYALLSALCAMYFSDSVQSVVTLNWKTYSGEASTGESTPVWAQVVSYLIVLFPTITVSAAFPLYAISLAESLANAAPASLLQKISRKKLNYVLRISLALLAIGGAALVRDVSKVLEFEGLFGFVLAFFAPCLLQYFSKRVCIRRFGPAAEKTPYSWHFSHDGYAIGIMVVTFGCFVYSLYTVILDYSS